MKQLSFLFILIMFTQSCSMLRAPVASSNDTDYIDLPGAGEKFKPLPVIIQQRGIAHTIFDVEDAQVITPAAPAEVPEVVKDPNQFYTYTVQKDDNLSYIALQLLGKRTKWRKLQKWNPKVLKNPRDISAGMVIKYQSVAKVKEEISGFRIYTVEKNDSLAKISDKLFGDKKEWKKLLAWNSKLLKKPHLITRGMELRYQIEAKSEAVREPASVENSFEARQEAEDLFGTYTVKKKDNLSKIARKLLGSRLEWTKLQSWNDEVLQNPHKLKPGMKLKYIHNSENQKR